MMEPDLTAKEVLRLEAKFWHDRADKLAAEIKIWEGFNSALVATHSRLIQERDDKIKALIEALRNMMIARADEATMRDDLRAAWLAAENLIVGSEEE